MEVDDDPYLPQDVTASILRALKLTQAEQLQALPMLQRDYKASQQQYGTRTHAGGALGNEPKDKPKKKNDRKR